MNLRTRISPETPAGPSESDLGWLLRRREILTRAIAEMEQHQLRPQLDRNLIPNVDELLAWARCEMGRIETELFNCSSQLEPARRRRRGSKIF